jgi:hypothetical protein
MLGPWVMVLAGGTHGGIFRSLGVCPWRRLWDPLWGSSLLSFISQPWGEQFRSTTHPCHNIRLSTGQKAVEPNNPHWLKLWAKISFSSLQVGYLRYLLGWWKAAIALRVVCYPVTSDGPGWYWYWWMCSHQFTMFIWVCSVHLAPRNFITRVDFWIHYHHHNSQDAENLDPQQGFLMLLMLF